MTGTDNDVATTLKMGAVHRRRRWWPWALGAALLIIAVIVLLRVLGGGAAQTTYMSEEVTRGDLVVLVNATGQLQPMDEVEVGAEVSGLVREVLVDFNDPVTTGQVLARIDTEELEASVVQAEANLAQAEASLAQARATAREAQSLLTRTRRLVEQNNASAQTLDTNEAAYDRAAAAVQGAEAGVAQSSAALDSARARLQDAEIVSPMDGFVLDRLVEPGQTVAASLSAPHLFTIAHDLSQMELQVDVDEADIGAVREGQSASFTVDAYPGRTFTGVITQVRNAPRETSGVITYEALLLVANDDLALRPGMSASADITVNRVAEALLVPNSALRFSPPEAPSAGFMVDAPGAERDLWIVTRGNELRPVRVTTGATNGSLTVVTGEGLAEGDRVATGVQQPGAVRGGNGSSARSMARTSRRVASGRPPARPPRL